MMIEAVDEGIEGSEEVHKINYVGETRIDAVDSSSGGFVNNCRTRFWDPFQRLQEPHVPLMKPTCMNGNPHSPGGRTPDDSRWFGPHGHKAPPGDRSPASCSLSILHSLYHRLSASIPLAIVRIFSGMVSRIISLWYAKYFVEFDLHNMFRRLNKSIRTISRRKSERLM